MKNTYDNYYQTENLFGKPLSGLISFFENYPTRGKLLDLGCGQGRDAIPLARLGYEVIGIDHSIIGIQQMNTEAKNQKLNLKGIVADIYKYDELSNFDFILLDSMFHFTKKDKKKETEFIRRIILNTKPATIIAFCIPDSGKKVEILNEAIDFHGKLERLKESTDTYKFKDDQTGHTSVTDYKIIVVKKFRINE